MAEAQAGIFPKKGNPLNKSSRHNWLVIAAILAPMLAAYFIFKTGVGIPQNTINKGHLLTPAVSIKTLEFFDAQGLEKTIFDETKIWRMLVITDGACESLCQKKLYLSRQVHIRLGEKAVRVERLLLNTGNALSVDVQTFLDKEHPRLKRYSIDKKQWQNILGGDSTKDQRLAAAHIYYVDQQGFAMMSYDETHIGADLLTDIKRLLKYSYED